MKQPAIEMSLEEMMKMTGMEMLDFLSVIGLIETTFINNQVIISNKEEEYNV